MTVADLEVPELRQSRTSITESVPEDNSSANKPNDNEVSQLTHKHKPNSIINAAKEENQHNPPTEYRYCTHFITRTAMYEV